MLDTVDFVSEKITIGRSTKMVDIVLDLTPTNTISRRHAEITRTQGGEGGKCYIIKDLVRTRMLELNTTCLQTRNTTSQLELVLFENILGELMAFNAVSARPCAEFKPNNFFPNILSPNQGSTNGVFVNGLKISEQPLKHGDMVQFGGAADIPVGTRFGGTGSHIR